MYFCRIKIDVLVEESFTSESKAGKGETSEEHPKQVWVWGILLLFTVAQTYNKPTFGTTFNSVIQEEL